MLQVTWDKVTAIESLAVALLDLKAVSFGPLEAMVRESHDRARAEDNKKRELRLYAGFKPARFRTY